MELIKILHLSDFHINSDIKVDIKDNTLPEKFISSFDQNIFSYLIDSIKDYTEETIDYIVFCGDLTKYGNYNGIKIGLSTLSNIANILKVPEGNVIYVPGNHDLNWNIDADGLHIERKFNDIKAEIGNYKYITPFFKIKSYVDSNWFSIIPTNSCLGGGIRRSELDKYLRNIRIRPLDKEKIKNIIQLDIPSFGNRELKRINEISRISNNFNIVVSHHNVLPCPPIEIKEYSVPIDSSSFIYQELIKQKYTLHLHGHKHNNNMIEIAKIFDDDKRRFISCGVNSIGESEEPSFNLIYLFFDNGILLDFEVDEYTLDNHRRFQIIKRIKHIISDFVIDNLYDEIKKIGKPEITLTELKHSFNNEYSKRMLLDKCYLLEKQKLIKILNKNMPIGNIRIVLEN